MDEPGEETSHLEMEAVESGDETAGNAKGTFQVRVGWAVLTMTRKNIFEHVYYIIYIKGHLINVAWHIHHMKGVLQANKF